MTTSISERAGRFDLGVGGAPAAVLGHQSFDPFALHELELIGERERSAREYELAMGQGVDLRRRIDRAHDVAMLRRSRECGELQPALGEEDCFRLGAERGDRLVDGRDLDPAIAGLARPRRAG